MSMQRQFKILIVLVAICTGLSGCGCKRQAARKTVAKPGKRPVVVQKIEAYGTVKAREYKDINLEFPAQITRVPVKNGQHVKLGEALVYLNINDFQAQLNNKRNELHSARFELGKQQKTLRDAEESYDRARRKLKNLEYLQQQGIIPREEVDDYRDTVLEKEKVVTDIRLSLDQTAPVNGLKVLNEKVAVLEYDLDRMQRKLAQSFLKGNVIVSDFKNAVVYDINCAAGYTVGTGDFQQQKLLSIMNLDSLYVSADVPEEFIKDVKIGAAVTIIPLADRKHRYHGKVVRVADMAVKTNGETNVAVEIAFKNADGFLRPNFNVDVEIKK